MVIEPVTILQNRWYNSIIAHLHLNRSLFQIHQSSDPMIHSDKDLWAIQNNIPPLSLTFNSSIYKNELFFDEYTAIVSQLQYPEILFKKDIGEEVYEKWLNYLKNITPPPPDSKLPIIFRNWSMISAPSVMSVGTTDLSRMVLINRILTSLQSYQGLNTKMIDFSGDYAQILNTLDNSTGVTFIFDSNFADSSIEDTWAAGNNSGLSGLWSRTCSTSRLSRRFALSHIKVNVQIKSYAVYTSVPGPWYNSSLLNIAYSNRNSSPWPINPNPTWEDVFGQSGSMQRLIVSLVVADGMNVSVTSDACFCKTDQQIIHCNASSGLWPFYIPSKNNMVTNVVIFDDVKGMKIETVAQPGNPLVIGNNILAIAQYLGQATTL